MEELISVVIPVYNVEKFLDRCVESVVNQTYKNLEIILVDDGSSDSSSSICDKWAERDCRIKVFHKENIGAGMARNVGIEYATGKYICFVDSDDYIDLKIIEKSYHLSQKERADITVFGLRKVSKDGKMLKSFIPKAEVSVFSGREIQDVFLPDLINGCSEDAKIQGLSLSACVCLFSMELIKRANWEFVSEKEIISEDSYSLIKLYKYVNKVAILSEVGYYYCNNSESFTQSYRTDRFEKFKDFYYASLRLQKEMGYTDKIKERLARLFLGFCIGLMKQIVSSNLSLSETKGYFKQIVFDKTTQEILKSITYKCYGIPIKILFSAMKYRMYNTVRLLVKLQVSIR